METRLNTWELSATSFQFIIYNARTNVMAFTDTINTTPQITHFTALFTVSGVGVLGFSLKFMLLKLSKEE